MLVLTRRADTEGGKKSIITVQDDIEITVISVDGDTVEQGITAPQEASVRTDDTIS